MLAVMPQKEVQFEDEMVNFNFPVKNSLKLAKTFGLGKRRVVEDGITASDLCVFGIKYLLDNNLLNKRDISAIIFVSQTPDYIQPPTSNVIHGQLNLGFDIICIDINQGCSGFILGLLNSYCLVNSGLKGKILLLNAETPSLIMSKRDRSSAPLFGDAATITIIEKTEIKSHTQFKIKNDGSRFDVLIIPAGGFRLRCSSVTCKEELQEDGNYRSMDHPHMKGDLVYNFTLNEAVDLIKEMIKDSIYTKDEIDYFMLHQPNKFILQNMAKKLDILEEKMPNNIVGLFGNSSGAALPVNIVYNLGNILEKQKLKLLLSAFGIGLAWNAATLELGELNFCKMISHK
jgi:3-oxoacyl-[acyl-carrier-protein] synthase-3